MYLNKVLGPITCKNFPIVSTHHFYKSWLLYILIRVNSKFHNISGCTLLGPW